MYYLKRVLIFFISLYLFQCKKNSEAAVFSKPPDTLKPLSYYPVFPGSFWLYINEKNDTVTYYTLDNYIKHSFDSGNTEAVFVPYLMHPVYGSNLFINTMRFLNFDP